MVDIGIIFDKLRFEEKALYDSAIKRGLRARLIDAKNLTICTTSKKADLHFGDIVLQRSVSHFRGLYVTGCLEFVGFRVINDFKVSQICGNKLVTSLQLVRNNISVPNTAFAFSSEGARNLMNELGYPVVLKPVVGSWGRGVFPIRDEETANMLLETREENGSALSRIYYVQEMINRPPRDLRCIVVGDSVVTAIYRYSSDNEWRTNVSRGGKAERATITRELEDIVLRAAKSVGGGVLGVDLMEDTHRGLLVNEVNNTVEFKGAQNVAEVDIADSIIQYAVNTAKK
jgi:[lysine-biosynthesis-protein LysW]---L-2-aminoadipate ligase